MCSRFYVLTIKYVFIWNILSGYVKIILTYRHYFGFSVLFKVRPTFNFSILRHCPWIPFFHDVAKNNEPCARHGGCSQSHHRAYKRRSNPIEWSTAIWVDFGASISMWKPNKRIIWKRTEKNTWLLASHIAAKTRALSPTITPNTLRGHIYSITFV